MQRVGMVCKSMPERLRRNRMPALANRTWCGMEGLRALQRLPMLLNHPPAPRLWLIAEGGAVVGAAHAAALGLQGSERGMGCGAVQQLPVRPPTCRPPAERPNTCRVPFPQLAWH